MYKYIPRLPNSWTAHNFFTFDSRIWCNVQCHCASQVYAWIFKNQKITLKYGKPRCHWFRSYWYILVHTNILVCTSMIMIYQYRYIPVYTGVYHYIVLIHGVWITDASSQSEAGPGPLGSETPSLSPAWQGLRLASGIKICRVAAPWSGQPSGPVCHQQTEVSIFWLHIFMWLSWFSLFSLFSLFLVINFTIFELLYFIIFVLQNKPLMYCHPHLHFSSSSNLLCFKWWRIASRCISDLILRTCFSKLKSSYLVTKLLFSRDFITLFWNLTGATLWARFGPILGGMFRNEHVPMMTWSRTSRP